MTRGAPRKRLQLTTNKSHALRQKLGIDNDPQCMHMQTFMFGKSKHPMFSDNALVRMGKVLAIVSPPNKSTASI
jgi:hypothetical protein